MFSGEMAFLEDRTATAAVVAKDEVEVDVIWADDLRQLIAAFPGLARGSTVSLAVILAQRLRQTTKQLLREMTSKR